MKLYKKEIYKTKNDWLNSRGFGGSSASAILGKNPYMSSLDLYKAIVLKTSNNNTTDQQSESMQYGVKLEPLLRKMFAEDFKGIYKIKAPYKYEMYRRKDKPYLTATLDGRLTELSTGKKGIWECKTHDIRNKYDDEMWQSGLPDNYFIQCLHYLLVMNDCDFVILTAKLRYFDYHHENGRKLLNQKIIYHFIWRDEVKDQIEYLEKKETEFWENNIQNKIMPKINISF